MPLFKIKRVLASEQSSLLIPFGYHSLRLRKKAGRIGYEGILLNLPLTHHRDIIHLFLFLLLTNIDACLFGLNKAPKGFSGVLQELPNSMEASEQIHVGAQY